MKGFLKLCMFCGAALPPPATPGRRDHIVPRLLKGSWCTQDVCVECNSCMGAEVDHKALEDARVVDAIHNLDLPDLKAKLLDKAHSETVDLDTGKPIPAKTKHGRPKITRYAAEGIVHHDESSGFEEVRRVLRKRPLHDLSSAQVDTIIDERLKPGFARLEPGEVIDAPEFGLRFRKGRARTTHRYRITPRASDRLIAKIVYEAAFFFFPPQSEKLRPFWSQLDNLRRFARWGRPLKEYTILYPPRPTGHRYDPSKAGYEHRITCWYQDGFVPIDISLFRLADFRVCLFPVGGRGDGVLVHQDQRIIDCCIKNAMVLTKKEAARTP